MAVDMFMIIDPLKGESRDKEFGPKKAMDVLAWSWGLSNSGNAHSGGGGGAGVVHVSDLSFTKYVDAASSGLMVHACTGHHFEKATLTLRKAGGKPMPYYEVIMEQVFVTSISTGGSGGEDRLTENVSLNFAKVTVNYWPQKADGTPDAVIPMTYDIAGKSKV